MSDLPEPPPDASISPEMERRLGFYSRVGQAISTWASTESLLVEIAATLLGNTREKAGIVLYSINNFYVWLSILEDLMDDDPHWKPHKSKLTPIFGRMRELNDLRVRLAHHYVPFPITTEPTLTPDPLDRRTKSRKHVALTDEEILGFMEAVNNICRQLVTAHLQLRALRPTSR